MKNLLRSLVIILILTSCGGLKNFPVSPDLYENKWVLEMENSLSKKNDIYLIFDKKNSRFGGFGGCSSIGGEYSMVKGFIRFSKIFSTQKSCAESKDTESALLSLLEEANQIRMEKDKLYLYKEKILLLSFKKQPFNEVPFSKN
ncbi:META domain-containing protein [Bacteroidetes bacterium endosymbiont of Geopemphigus sp.]|uniref:META domain-containing protein n=1 Tax=Bacteroidetes bacterium endosymbiont of Geopemphigus sp. TaxID=2047937 RepID=UPI000CD0DEBC|nr:META domain-containing protein [Bacteroidetes bacterium endosymbiont of Geopemphigus sp.]